MDMTRASFPEYCEAGEAGEAGEAFLNAAKQLHDIPLHVVLDFSEGRNPPSRNCPMAALGCQVMHPP
jgi:hypothetical protein